MNAPHSMGNRSIEAIPISWKALTPHQIEKARDRIRRWKKRDLWRLREACDLVYGFIPFWLYRMFNFNDADSEELLDYAERAVAIGRLKVANQQGAPADWWVGQEEFCKWITTRTDLVGVDRVNLFRELYPTADADQRQILRQKVFESAYTSLEFEAALAAIEQFWMPDANGKIQDQKADVIMAWLAEQHPEVCKGEAARIRIDALIRPDEFKSGGAKKQKRAEPD